MVPSAKWVIKDTAESKSLHTDLTGTSDFSNFVKPRLAIGPKGDHNPARPESPSGFGAVNGRDSVVSPASNDSVGLFSQVPIGRGPSATQIEVWDPVDDKPFAKAVKLAPKQSIEIDIPAQAGQNFGLTFMADPAVSATLIDAAGAVVAKNLSGSPEARSLFRSMFVDKAITAGTWKLRLENTGTAEFDAVLTTWTVAAR